MSILHIGDIVLATGGGGGTGTAIMRTGVTAGLEMLETGNSVTGSTANTYIYSGTQKTTSDDAYPYSGSPNWGVPLWNFQYSAVSAATSIAIVKRAWQSVSTPPGEFAIASGETSYPTQGTLNLVSAVSGYTGSQSESSWVICSINPVMSHYATASGWDASTVFTMSADWRVTNFGPQSGDTGAIKFKGFNEGFPFPDAPTSYSAYVSASATADVAMSNVSAPFPAGTATASASAVFCHVIAKGTAGPMADFTAEGTSGSAIKYTTDPYDGASWGCVSAINEAYSAMSSILPFTGADMSAYTTGVRTAVPIGGPIYASSVHGFI